MKSFYFILIALISLTAYSQTIEKIEIESNILGEDREIMVYLPRLYEESVDKQYEVVYVFDAQARQYFDLVHSNLTFLNNAVPTIVVGVVSKLRDEDFLPAYNHEESAKMMQGEQGKADMFLQYLEKEVFPYVDKNYRTLPAKVAVGHSNGGVFILYSLIERPGLFDAFIAISPHLRYDRMQMIDRFEKFDPSEISKPIFFYMAKGNESSKNWETSISKAKALFEQENYAEKIHFEYDFFPDLDHTTVIPSAVINGFNSWFNYQYWNIDHLKEYYHSLKNEKDYQISERDLAGFIYNRYWAKDFENAKLILDWGQTLYSDSEMLQSIAQNLDAPLTNNKEEQGFPEKYLGVWEGTMFISKYNEVKDSVKVRFTAAKTEVDSIYSWKMEYLSPARPVTKDYKLIEGDNKGEYIIDEGNDVKLKATHIGNKLFSAFKIGGNLLTSSYEIVNGSLVFEVSSGKEISNPPKESATETNKAPFDGNLKNYNFSNLQRAVLKKVE